MENFAKDFITLLQYLVPGFVAAWIFYSFTSYPKPSQFERVIQALIFTIIVQAFVYLILYLGSKWFISDSDSNLELICSLFVAVFLGIIFSYFVNNDNFHKIFRKIGVTKETSYPSEWFSAFVKNDSTYIVLHLEGERRLYGWLIRWPSDPDNGHFVIEQAAWINEKDEQIPLTGVSSIMIDAREVTMVEFMKKNGR